MNELHLKFHSETGTRKTSDIYLDDDGQEIEITSTEYIEWLEELALKQLKSEKIIADAKKVNDRMVDVKINFDALNYIISCMDDDVPEHDLLQDACGSLYDSIYGND